MLNWIWLGMIVIGFVTAAFTGRMGDVSSGLIKSAHKSVELALPLGGLMALMLGVMRLVERSGLIILLSRAARPLMKRLFPEVPADHPAIGSMMLNMAANFLGAGNAASPMGLKAMAQLEQLNPNPGTATNAQILFLGLNTSAISLVSVTALSLMQQYKSANPTAVILPSIAAAFCGALTAVILAKILPPFFPSLAPTMAPDSIEGTATAASAAEEKKVDLISPTPLKHWGYLVMGVAFLVLLASLKMTVDHAPGGLSFQSIAPAISNIVLPGFIVLVILYAALSGVKVFEEFTEGAKEGVATALRIIPFLVAMLLAIGILQNSGTLSALTYECKRLLAFSGFSQKAQDAADLLPLMLMRPLSGSGSSAMLAELIQKFGPDSFIGRSAATMYGSTETTFYVLAVYFGSVGLKRIRHALIVGLCADAVAMIVAIILSSGS